MNESIETVLYSFLMEVYKWEDNANKHIDAGTGTYHSRGFSFCLHYAIMKIT